MTLLAALPTELLTYILTYTPFKDVLSLQSTCRLFHSLVSGSVLLQYRNLLQASGMLDDTHSSLNLRARYEMLKEREKSWLLFQPRFTQNIPVHHSSVVIYELSGGAYMLSEVARRTVDYIILPRDVYDPVPEWRKLSVDEISNDCDPQTGDQHDSQQLLDFGLAMREHDLLAVVTTIDRPEPSTTLRISWVQLSTGKRHPLSGPPMTFIQDAPFDCIGVGIEIVGDLTALVLRDARPDHFDRDRVLVLDWRKGMIRAEFSSQHRRYQNAIFLSHDVLLIPNAYKGSIELWRIPEVVHSSSGHSQTQSQPLELATPNLTLFLPSVSNGFMIQDFACRSAPNPSHSAHSSTNYPKRPFHSDPEQSIIVFHLSTAPINARMSIQFVLIAHRKLFLGLLDKHGYGYGCMNLDYDDKINLNPRYPSPPTPFPYHAHSPPSLSWSSWGPSRTRFFGQGQQLHTEWITTTSGQRYVMLQTHRGVYGIHGHGQGTVTAPGQEVMVLDFNESMVKRVKKAFERVEEVRFRIKKKMEMEEQARFGRLMTMVLSSVSDDVHDREHEKGSLSPSAASSSSTVNSDDYYTPASAPDGSGSDSDSSLFQIPLLDVSISLGIGGGSGNPDLNTIPGFSGHIDYPGAYPQPFLPQNHSHTQHQHHSQSQPTRFPVGSDTDLDQIPIHLVEGPSDTNSTLLKKIFSEPIGGSLPYVMSFSEIDRNHGLHGVVMDDERILGVRRSSFLGGVESVEVLWFG